MTEQTTLPVKTGNGQGQMRRWDPFETLGTLQEEMARFWDQLMPVAPFGTLRPFRRPAHVPMAWTPRMDVFEKEGNLVVKAELPGIAKDDIEVKLDGGDLVIRGERTAESEVKEEDYYRLERSFGSFYRRLPLSFDVRAEDVKATFADGVLEVRIPKPAETKPAAQKIPVK